MAVLQAQAIDSNGYAANSTLFFQASITANIANGMQTITVTLAAVSLAVGLPANALLIAIAITSVSSGYFVNYLSRLARFFGIRARQDINYLYIQKSDLPLLAVSLSNTAESLLIALLLQVMLYESNSLISRVTVDAFKTEFATVNSRAVIRSILLIRLYSLVTRIENFEIVDSNAITPNSFN
ncbi:hypothetical protein [Chroococcidiopsis sp.]|uniref:hypothetical protein n=1 Tax=Chroococcidiopsis sp. TaxID=3088168 RepID=UPI003F3498D0